MLFLIQNCMNKIVVHTWHNVFITVSLGYCKPFKNGTLHFSKWMLLIKNLSNYFEINFLIIVCIEILSKNNFEYCLEPLYSRKENSIYWKKMLVRHWFGNQSPLIKKHLNRKQVNKLDLMNPQVKKFMDLLAWVNS